MGGTSDLSTRCGFHLSAKLKELSVVSKGSTQQREKYVIVRTGDMERKTNDFQLTDNLHLDSCNALAGGLVSHLQVTDLSFAAVLNPGAADGKIVECIAESDTWTHDYLSFLNISNSD